MRSDAAAAGRRRRVPVPLLAGAAGLLLVLARGHAAGAAGVAPVIPGITPASGPPGTAVRIDGTNFVPGQTTAAFTPAGGGSGSSSNGTLPSTCSSTVLCVVTA